MRKRDLEIALQGLDTIKEPDFRLEQYATPATIAADVLFTAYANGDLAGKRVLDLGCGNGVFAIGAWMLGASEVTGVDVSEASLSVAKENAERLGAEVDWVHSNVSSFEGKADTVIMNPPFGCQNKGADRPFLEKAMDSADVIYSLHMAETLPFLDRYASTNGRQLSFHKEYKYDIPHMFTFHRRAKESIHIVMIIIR